LSSILGNRGQIETIKLDVAKSLDPQISFLQTAQGLLVSASGGVMIESWHFATQVKENESVAGAKVAITKLDNDKIWYQ
jgi:hypothetical protein